MGDGSSSQDRTSAACSAVHRGTAWGSGALSAWRMGERSPDDTPHAPMAGTGACRLGSWNSTWSGGTHAIHRLPPVRRHSGTANARARRIRLYPRICLCVVGHNDCRRRSVRTAARSHFSLGPDRRIRGQRIRVNHFRTFGVSIGRTGIYGARRATLTPYPDGGSGRARTSA